MEIKPEKKRNRFFLELFRVTVKMGGDEQCQYCTGADITLRQDIWIFLPRMPNLM
jgi:hypothetical protein